MNRRARRITVEAVALVAAVLAGFVAAYWGPVRDHVEAWRFQLTTETKTEEPSSTASESVTAGPTGSRLGRLILYGILARYSGRAVVFENIVEEDTWIDGGQTVGGADVVGVLKDDGYRVLEQRFPRRAYVVIRDAAAPEESFPETIRVRTRMPDRSGARNRR